MGRRASDASDEDQTRNETGRAIAQQIHRGNGGEAVNARKMLETLRRAPEISGLVEIKQDAVVAAGTHLNDDRIIMVRPQSCDLELYSSPSR
jgi:hypothetical protein